MNWQFVAVLSLTVSLCNAYKVLFIAPVKAQSHFIFMSSFARALLDRGHVLTYLTSNSLSHLNLKNYTEILIDTMPATTTKFPQEQFIEMFRGSIFSAINAMSTLGSFRNLQAYENPNVQKFIKSTDQNFDIIVAEEFYHESFMMFAHKFKAPIVTICSFGVTEFVDRQQGLITPSSFVPHWFLPYTDNMSFLERWHNILITAYEWFERNFIYLPSEQRLAQKYFGHLAPLPPLNDILRNISLILANSHRAISPPRPAMPNVISIGGAHITPAKPLPNDLKTFLDDSKDGVIYFSFGSLLQVSKLPKKLIDAFLSTFKKLKQRVLWKLENDSLAEIPLNVMVRSWMPQNDILAHPNVVLFISHGGLLGTTESLYHGVPLLLVPFFSDQFRNAYRIDAAGYGKYLNSDEITEELFTKTVNELIGDKSYLEKAKYTSAVYKDNLVHPMDEAMFWIEHVAKFKGAKHLKSYAVNISWFTYFSIDIILVNLLAVLVIFIVLRILLKLLFGKKKINEKSKQKQN